jgi:hypothetical protein
VDVHAWFGSGFEFAETLGSTGCDFALWWPERRCLVPVWAIVQTSDGAAWESELDDAAAALKRLVSSLRRTSGSAWDVTGLVLSASTSVKSGATDGPTESRSTDPRIVGIRCGGGGDLGVSVDDFEAALMLAAERHLRR